MSKVYETLKKKNDTSVEVYPNIERTNIPDGAINTAKVEDASITTNKIVDAAVTTAKINDAAVTTAKINDGAVTSDKIADGSIVYGKIGNNAISSLNIMNGQVVPANLYKRILIHTCTLKVTSGGNDYYFPLALFEFTHEYQTSTLTDYNDFVRVWSALYYDYQVPLSKGAVAQMSSDFEELNIHLVDNTSITANSLNVTIEDYDTRLLM